ncbi:MAG: hypothetical protein ACRDLL_11310 [Solirubrobacterales bacterium]
MAAFALIMLGMLIRPSISPASASGPPPNVPTWWSEAASFVETLPPSPAWPSNQCSWDYQEEEQYGTGHILWAYESACGGEYPMGTFTFACYGHYGNAPELNWRYGCALEESVYPWHYDCGRSAVDWAPDTGWYPDTSQCDTLISLIHGEGGAGGEGGGDEGGGEGEEEEPTPKECEEAGLGPHCEYVEEDNGEEPKEEAPEEKPCEKSHHGFVHHKWSARAALVGLPDPHLFDFNVSIPYCYNGKTAKVNGPSAVGTVNYGFATGVLEVLGFETIYDPAKEVVYASDFGTAEMTGEFGMTFAWMTLLDKVGIKKFLKDKAEAYLAKELEQSIPKYGYGNGLRRHMALEMSKLKGQIMDTLEKRLDKIKPSPLRKWLEPKVLSKMEGFLDKWRKQGTALFSSRNLKKSVASKVVGTLFKIIDPRSTFPMWRPVVSASVTTSGAASVQGSDDYKNPWLVTTQTE